MSIYRYLQQPGAASGNYYKLGAFLKTPRRWVREECKIDLEFRMIPLENHVQVAQYKIEQSRVQNGVFFL
jgi:hypothetical protein